MNLDSSNIYNSSIIQANLLYLYLQRNLSSELMECQRQLVMNKQKLPFSQVLFEVIHLPKTECLDIINEPIFSLNNSIVKWEMVQSRNAFSMVDMQYLADRNILIDWIDDQFHNILYKLAKTILQNTEQIHFAAKFIKIIFPSEGMFTSYIDNNLIFLGCKVAILVAPKYFCLPQVEVPHERIQLM